MSPDSRNEYLDRLYCESDQFYQNVEKIEELMKKELNEGNIILSYLNNVVENEEHFEEINNKILNKTMIFSSFISPSDNLLNPLIELANKSLTARGNLINSKYIPSCREILNSLAKFLQSTVSSKMEDTRKEYAKSKESWYEKLLEMFKSSKIIDSDEITKIRKSYKKSATNYYYKLEQMQELIISVIVWHILEIDSYFNARCPKENHERGIKIPDNSKPYLELQERINENIKKLGKILDSDKDMKNLQNILNNDLAKNDGYVQVEIENNEEKNLAYLSFNDKSKSISIRVIDVEPTRVHKYTIDSLNCDENECSITVTSGKHTICLTCLDKTSMTSWANLLGLKEKNIRNDENQRKSKERDNKWKEKDIKSKENDIKSKDKDFTQEELLAKSFSPTFFAKLFSIVMKSSDTIGLYEKKSSNTKISECIQKANSSSKKMDDCSALDASNAIKTALLNIPPLIDSDLYIEYESLTDNNDIYEIRKIINKISPKNFEILEMLIKNFTCLLASKDQNELDAGKLSLIFAPLIIRNTDEINSEKASEFIFKLIVEYQNIFYTSKFYDREEESSEQISSEDEMETKKDQVKSKGLVDKYKKAGFFTNLANKLKKDKNKNDDDKPKKKEKSKDKEIFKDKSRRNKIEDNRKDSESTMENDETCSNDNENDKNDDDSSSGDGKNNDNLDGESNEEKKAEKENKDGKINGKKKVDKNITDFDDFIMIDTNEKCISKNEKLKDKKMEMNKENESSPKKVKSPNEDKKLFKSKTEDSNPMIKMEFEKRDHAILGNNMKRPTARGNLGRNPKATLNFVSAEIIKESDINKDKTIKEKEPKEIKIKDEQEMKRPESNIISKEKYENRLKDNSKVSSSEKPMIEKKSSNMPYRLKENISKETEQTKNISKSDEILTENKKYQMEKKNNEKIDNAAEKSKSKNDLIRNISKEINEKNIESRKKQDDPSYKKDKESTKDLEESDTEKDDSNKTSDDKDNKHESEDKDDNDQGNASDKRDITYQANDTNTKGDDYQEIKKDTKNKSVNEDDKKDQNKKDLDSVTENIKDSSPSKILKKEIEVKDAEKNESKEEEKENNENKDQMKSIEEIKTRRVENVLIKHLVFTKNPNLKPVTSKSSIDEPDKEETSKKENTFFPVLKKVEKRAEITDNDEKEITPGNILEKDRINLRTPQKSLPVKSNEKVISSNRKEIPEVKKAFPSIPKKASIDKNPSNNSSNELMQKLIQRRCTIQQEEDNVKTESIIQENKKNETNISNSTESVEGNIHSKFPHIPKSPITTDAEIKSKIPLETLISSSEKNLTQNDKKIYSTNQKAFILPPKKEIPEIPKRK